MSGERILVVDDEPDIRRLVQEILEDEGYRVTTAENAANARSQVKTSPPDLALVWACPGISSAAAFRVRLPAS